MLVVLLKKNYNTKITEIEKKLTGHNHDKCITTPESNSSAAGVFNAILSQPNLITKTDFDAKLSRRIKQKNNRNLWRMKQKIYLLKIRLKS